MILTETEVLVDEGPGMMSPVDAANIIIVTLILFLQAPQKHFFLLLPGLQPLNSEALFVLFWFWPHWVI